MEYRYKRILLKAFGICLKRKKENLNPIVLLKELEISEEFAFSFMESAMAAKLFHAGNDIEGIYYYPHENTKNMNILEFYKHIES